MKLKYKKILAQILSVAVAGSNFAVPVVCTNNPIISVNAEESEQDTHDDNEEEVTDEYYSEEDYSEEEYSDEEYFEEEYSDEEYFEEDYFDDEYSEEDDIYDVEETTPQESEQMYEVYEILESLQAEMAILDEMPYDDGWKKAYVDFLKEKYAENNQIRFILAYIDNDDIPELILESGFQHYATGGAYVYNNGSVVESGVNSSDGQFFYCEKSNIIYTTSYTNGNGGTSKRLLRITNGEFEQIVSFYSYYDSNKSQNVYKVNDEEVTKEQYDAKIKEYQIEDDSVMGEPLTRIQYLDMYEITDENIDEYIGTIEEDTSSGENSGTSTTTSTGTTTETTTTTTTKEPAITYEWYVEPSVEADDINSVGIFMESISYDKDDYEYNYGQFADTGYAIVKDGDFYGVIDMDGNVVIETDYVLIRGAINDHFRLYDEEGKYTYFCCETGEYLDPQEPYCAWCERTLLSDVCSSYYCYDPDRDLLAYIGVMPKNNNEESVSLNSQNGSGTTIDFPEGKTIPVRMVSIESDDEVILYDSYGIMRDGEIIVDFNYDNALSYKDGITAVEQDGEWYYYDEDGYQIIEDSCEGSYYFNINNEDYIPYLPSEEYIAFNTAWGGGYYSTDGGVVIPVGEFAEARPVFNGLAWVKDHATGLWGVIQLTGERADAPENNDDNSDSEEDGDENNSSNSSSNNSSSSSGSNGKAAPKTGDDFGNVFALLALSLGVMVVSMKRREK